MIKVKRELLSLVAPYIDTNNPKFEFNYLCIDSKCIVSTNTRAIAIIKHGCEVKEDIYIHKSIVDLALKQAKAKFFVLDANSITCLDMNGDELFVISSNDNVSFGKFFEYSRIIPKSVERSVRFTDSSQVNGIFAVNGVLVDVKYIPKKFPEDFRGLIGMNDSNLPVTISEEGGDVMIVIMPIIDNYFKFVEEE